MPAAPSPFREPPRARLPRLAPRLSCRVQGGIRPRDGVGVPETDTADAAGPLDKGPPWLSVVAGILNLGATRSTSG